MGSAEQMVAAYIKQQTGREVRVSRLVDDHLYSAHLFPALAAAGIPRDFFSAGVGTTGQGFAAALTRRETNLPGNGQLPNETAMVVQSIGVKIDEHALLADEQDLPNAPLIVSDLLNHGYLELDQPDYKRTLGPLWMFTPSGGMVGGSVVNNMSILNNGRTGYDAMWHLGVPMVLAAGASYKMNIILQGADGFAALTNTAAFTVWVELVGKRATLVVSG